MYLYVDTLDRDGIARSIIQDVLKIQAGRDHSNYGMDIMFKRPFKNRWGELRGGFLGRPAPLE